MNQFNRLEQFAKLQRPPAVKFKDLEAAVNSRISYNILPMKVRADFFPLTEASVLTYVTLQFDNKDLQFHAKDGVQKASVNIFGKVSTMTRRIVTNFEDTVEVTSPPEYLQQTAQRKSVYNKSCAPGSRTPTGLMWWPRTWSAETSTATKWPSSCREWMERS